MNGISQGNSHEALRHEHSYTDHNKDTFARFAHDFDLTLNQLATPNSSKAGSSQEKQLWSGFHLSRTSELRCMWEKLFTDMGMDPEFAKDPLISEYVNKNLFEDHVKATFEVAEQQPEQADLTDDELNALRYAGGFVPWKLRQKFNT